MITNKELIVFSAMIDKEKKFAGFLSSKMPLKNINDKDIKDNYMREELELDIKRKFRQAKKLGLRPYGDIVGLTSYYSPCKFQRYCKERKHTNKICTTHNILKCLKYSTLLKSIHENEIK